MDDMDMGMSMSGGVFTSDNMLRAQVFWYLTAASVGILTLVRVSNHIQSSARRRRSSVSKPSNFLSQLAATTTAIYREFAYPQPIYFTGRISKYFSPPPVGRLALLACYWIVILVLLWSDAILPDSNPYVWEKVGFRAAWISVTQIPFIYLLSCKFNPISLLTGISYERFNWLHRWAARTVFLTVAVHWSYFFREWWLADFVDLELEMMPMVKYGFGAWAVIGWMIVSGFGFFRAANYELFVIQHIFAAAVLLWLVFVHVPAYAMYNVWMAIGFVAFDWGVRLLLGILRNTHVLGRMQLPGYSASLEALPGDMTKLTISDIDFKWRAGQHVYLSIPALRPLELHPFTIASSSTTGQLSLLIKAHKGFSRSLHRASGKRDQYRVLINGPFGIPPDVSHHETVVLVACSTGVSFTLPILQDLLSKKICARQINFFWMVRRSEHMQWVGDVLAETTAAAEDAGIKFNVCVHVTDLAKPELVTPERSVSTDAASSVSQSSSSVEQEKGGMTVTRLSSGATSMSRVSVLSCGRPTFDGMIRPAVEGALGETAIVACGSLQFTAQIRTYVASLSDERAVHKGTGAQGIFLFTETYGWG